MKSIRSKILGVVFVSVTFTALILLIICVVSMSVINERDSNMLLEHIGMEHATAIDMQLEAIEHSVDSIYYYAIDRLEENASRLNDEAFRTEYIDKIRELSLSEARNTESVKVVYFRLSTDIKEPPYGFIYQANDRTGVLREGELTDISLYDPSDVEHVGWYYLPMEAGKAIWMDPYQNKNLGIKMISYVAPIFLGGRFIGIVGMDVDIDVLNKELAQIKMYETGSAILFDGNDNIVYQKDHANGINVADFGREQNNILSAKNKAINTGDTVQYTNDTGDAKLYATPLKNGMTLCINVPVDEINSTQRSVLAVSVLLSLVILTLTVVGTIFLINGFLRPLSELTEASEQLTNGNLDIHLEYKSDDEIGQLAKTYETMASSLKNYFDHFHSLAYTDDLTGLNNKAAFNMTRAVIESEISMGRADFSLIIMDVNNLKIINDSLGHELGDELLRHAVRCMRKAFVGYPLYRIGGDEFAAIINHAEPKGLVQKLQNITAESSKEDEELFHCSYQIAAGGATYIKGHDRSFGDVFDRADRAMYENKSFLKEQEK